MKIANDSQSNAFGLPQALRIAQDAIGLPEVQQMLRRLSEYNLGIFMPHMHDEKTGEFRSLPDEVIQVESGLGVSFQPTEEVASNTHPLLPVGWSWRAGSVSASAACEMIWEEMLGDKTRTAKHEMLKRR